MASPKIILYTYHGCPFAHRAHIALKETGVDYEEVIIDIKKPREPWYLEINPRGLVPAISYNGEILIESAIVAQFIADAHPSHLLPPSGPAENALYRARVSLFADAFSSKVMPNVMAGVRAASQEERETAGDALVEAVAKEIEPLLNNEGKGPFFGGSEKLTFAEVLTGSFLLRILAFTKPEHNLNSTRVPALLKENAPKFLRWAEATVAQESVNYIWNEQAVVEHTRAKFAHKP
ncbi:glutathione S-transferase family protein [Aspergillus glaucus CBS 516.65]|uniref:GST N-terminal domain-containing protein n=1 Tax=Aspergillus glaucus CBS 516.65 TaxID=1160497 RepID=A0A1L9VCQ5_ASPGL|nr:hypothetical protein ASPGLDRAFT_50269 [Aspergillus glaucus CBS 516.65]OJJ81717.1 hypothetical protein ASPGLDRAFT_50269 [Aspergillus glaucus CBS 516.65]